MGGSVYSNSIRVTRLSGAVPLCEAQIEQPLGEVLRAWLRNPEARRP